MRVMTNGTNLITKQDAGRGLDAQFLVLGEGLSVVLLYINLSVTLDAEFATLRTLLITYCPLCASFSAPFRWIIESRSMTPATPIKQTCSLCVAGPGSHIVRFPVSQSNDST
ncbi:uncharacterized protein EDB91DRAFT_1130256 [Suillus paluster]|uniref:uncharacterized protein n=1 Tax=Suillus paluster TaxID=48578 RepID=UPI001B85D732|nr:uncharacterized protein EDB91DRAFT_1130256 [Suillus paluster]KAG1741412.1 hypothetical protein EDB91DRAFT_1130256 [Suillus paluster]